MPPPPPRRVGTCLRGDRRHGDRPRDGASLPGAHTPLMFCGVFCATDQSTPASQSPHSSNPSSLPSSPPTHSHGAAPFSNFGPIGTPDSRDRRLLDRWKTDKTGNAGDPR